MTQTVTPERIESYCRALAAEERATGTIAKYRRDLSALAVFLDRRALTPERTAAWKVHLLGRGCAPQTVNGKLAALNGFCRFWGWPLRAPFLKVQRQLFRDSRRELRRQDYQRLCAAADGLAARLLEALSATGVRVSEVKFLTVEALRQGRAEIHLKGKIRTVLLPKKLCQKLSQFAKEQYITAGEIFRTPEGKPLSRFQIWRILKALARRAGVELSRVFPHNLRRLFAVAFYRVSRDLAGLADLLGHSSIETTRIYLTVSCAQKRRQLDRLGLLQ